MFITFNNFTNKLQLTLKFHLINKFMMGNNFIKRLKNQDLYLNLNKIFKSDI